MNSNLIHKSLLNVKCDGAEIKLTGVLKRALNGLVASLEPTSTPIVNPTVPSYLKSKNTTGTLFLTFNCASL